MREFSFAWCVYVYVLSLAFAVHQPHAKIAKLHDDLVGWLSQANTQAVVKCVVQPWY